MFGLPKETTRRMDTCKSYRVQLPMKGNVKGQWGVPLTVYPWYLLCSLGILGDNLPINTHYIV